jgi:hypothetical protein
MADNSGAKNPANSGESAATRVRPLSIAPMLDWTDRLK